MKLKQLSRIIPALVVFFAVLSIQTVVLANPVRAVEAPESVIDRDAKSWLTYRAVWEDCIHEGKNVTRNDLTNGQWFNSNNSADFGYYTYDLGDEGDDKTIDISCADGSAMDRFADQIMGFGDEIEMYCVLDDKLDDRGEDAKGTIEPEAGDADCEGSESWAVVWNRTSPGNWRGAFTDTLDEAPHYRMNLNLDDNQRHEGNWSIPGRYALKYWIGKESLEVMCGGSTSLTSGETDLSVDNSNVVSVHIVDYATGDARQANYELTGGRLDDGDEGDTEFKARFFNNKHEVKSCNGMAEDTRQYSEDFVWYITHYWAQAVADHFKAEFTVTGAMKRSICGPAPGRDQPQTAYSRCVLSITSTFNDKLEVCKNTDAVLKVGSELNKRTRDMKTCLDQQLDPRWRPGYQDIETPNVDINDDGDTSNPDESETSCAIDGIGWIVCPTMEFLGQLNDAAFGILNNFLQIEDELTTNSSLRAAWSTFRDMANIAFVIAFLIIIYSQVTGAGVTNYGIKRLMPKMIIAAVLVNASLILCQIAVDLSNIVGSTIYNLLTNLANADSGSTNAAGSWSETIGSLLGGAAIGVGLLLVIILAPTALLAVGAAVLILMARKAIIILLIVVAPLAFVAYLLPNTEDWFKKWWKMFSTLLMLFPVIGLVFGASSLAAGIINNVAGDADGQHLLQLTALGIMAVPLFAVPVVLKGAISAAGTVGQRLGGWQDRANKRGMRGVKESRLGEAKTAFDARRQSRKLNRRVGDGRFLGVIPSGRINKAIDSSRVGRYIGGDRGAAAATAAVFHEFDEEVKRQKTLLSGKTNEQLIGDLREGKGSEEYQAAVAGTIMGRDHRASHLEALSIMGKRRAAAAPDSKEEEVAQSIQKQMAHDMKDKPWALGDQAAGALTTGDYSGDLRSEMKTRVGTKLSVASLAKMNPDELKSIHKMARNGELSGPEMALLQKTISDLRLDPTHSGSEKGEATTLYNEILGGSYDTLSSGESKHYKDEHVF